MNAKRKIEIFSAGCPVCEETIQLVNTIACPSCEVSVLDMNSKGVAEHAKTLGINKIPAVVVDGKLAECCESGTIDADTLRRAGVGQEL